MQNRRSYLIKSVPNLFKNCPMVALPYENTDPDLVFPTLSLMALDFIKCKLGCDGFFSTESYDPHIFLDCIGS